MLNGPILVRTLEKKEIIGPATILGYITYIWMAFLMWFLFLSLTRDIWNNIFRLAAKATPAAYQMIIPPKPALYTILAIITAATVWGFVEGRGLRVEKVSIATPKMAAASSPIKIAQVSDIHFGLMEHGRRMDQIANILEHEKPDLLVATGDILDGTAMHVNDLSARFRAINPPLGKYAVTGNHEYYVKLHNSLPFLADSGFRILRGEGLMAGLIHIAGVDDPAGKHSRQASYTDEGKALAMNRTGDPFTILLKHQPNIDPASIGRFDLQLSGHTHKGQIYPFNYVVKLRHRYIAGLYNLAGGSMIYTSRGTGTWGPPLRLFAPAEVTIFTIEGED
jgi:predicted MPP superfamily phosphohydrolase